MGRHGPILGRILKHGGQRFFDRLVEQHHGTRTSGPTARWGGLVLLTAAVAAAPFAAAADPVPRHLVPMAVDLLRGVEDDLEARSGDSGRAAVLTRASEIIEEERMSRWGRTGLEQPGVVPQIASALGLDEVTPDDIPNLQKFLDTASKGETEAAVEEFYAAYGRTPPDGQEVARVVDQVDQVRKSASAGLARSHTIESEDGRRSVTLEWEPEAARFSIEIEDDGDAATARSLTIITGDVKTDVSEDGRDLELSVVPTEDPIEPMTADDLEAAYQSIFGEWQDQYGLRWLIEPVEGQARDSSDPAPNEAGAPSSPPDSSAPPDGAAPGVVGPEETEEERRARIEEIERELEGVRDELADLHTRAELRKAGLDREIEELGRRISAMNRKFEEILAEHDARVQSLAEDADRGLLDPETLGRKFRKARAELDAELAGLEEGHQKLYDAQDVAASAAAELDAFLALPERERLRQEINLRGRADEFEAELAEARAPTVPGAQPGTGAGQGPAESIEAKRGRIEEIKASKVYVWENPDTGERVEQTRFRRLKEPFEYVGETLSIPNGEEEIARLEREIAERDSAPAPPAALPVERPPPLAAPAADGKVRDIRVSGYRPDGSLRHWREARYTGIRIEAQTTITDIRDTGEFLPREVRQELAASWHPPNWIELKVRRERATGETRLEGRKWGLHVDRSRVPGGPWKVEKIHTPRSDPLVLRRQPPDLEVVTFTTTREDGLFFGQPIDVWHMVAEIRNRGGQDVPDPVRVRLESIGPWTEYDPGPEFLIVADSETSLPR